MFSSFIRTTIPKTIPRDIPRTIPRAGIIVSNTPFFSTLTAKSNLLELKDLVKKVEPNFFDLLPILSPKEDMYRECFGKKDFIGLKCCGASTWLMKGLLDLTNDSEKFETFIIGRENGAHDHEGDPDDHVYLGVKNASTGEIFIIDPTWKQIYYNSIDVNQYPSILIAPEEEAVTFLQGLSGLDSEPLWFIRDPSNPNDSFHEMPKKKLNERFDGVDLKALLDSGYDRPGVPMLIKQVLRELENDSPCLIK